MRPQDTNDSDNRPSLPPPQALPRPSMQMINDIRGMQRPPRAQVPPRVDSPNPGPLQQQPANLQQQPVAVMQPSITGESATPPSQSPRPVHPNDHLIDAPHEPLLNEGDHTPPSKKKKSLLRIIGWTLAGLLLLAIIALAAGVWWYQQQLLPVNASSSQHSRVVIAEGTSPSGIASQLKSQGVIRNQFAFSLYMKLSNTENQLKAGAYNFKDNESVQQIVDHLVSGKQDVFSITFLPGDTLANNRKKLIEAGYGEAEVDAALNKTYDRPLFAGKPTSTDLEGYIYGETYQFDSSSSVEAILNRAFDEYEKAIINNDLVNGFKKQGFSVYQGITLASIIQREVRGEEDERQVARVFLNRLAGGISLGSDVTYQYAAKKLGVDPTPTLDSPYNTRIYKGLPPGPISVPGIGALKAVANPGTNDYLFFLSGDDDVTYFAKTDAEHQKNIVNHCKAKCLIN